MTDVMIFRGHGVQPSGVHDPGATGGGWTEQTAVDVVAPVAAADLATAGVAVHDEGTDDPNFVGSVAEANRLGVDLVVALHFDWTGGLDAHVFHHSTSDVGEKLARNIADALADAGRPLASPAVRARDGLYVVRETQMPAVLVELGRIGEFGDTPRRHLEDLGHAVAAGILAHLDIDHTPAPAPTPKPTPKPKADSRNWTEKLVDNLPLLTQRPDYKTRATADDRRVQGLLVAAGVLDLQANTEPHTGRFDGKFGPSTKSAVRTFQSRAGLKVDGLVGRNTWTALLGG